MANRSIYGRICRSTAVITAAAVHLILLSVVAGFPEEGNAVVASGTGGSRAAVGGGNGGNGDFESEWNEVEEGRLDICARNPDAAEICSACPGLVPDSGVTAWRCCVDQAVHDVCSGAAAVIGRALVGTNIEDVETNLDKRAKYFLGKRAKYFLGKRAFGARRTGASAYHGGAFRSAARQQMMADGIETAAAADKRAKYFLG